MQYKKRICVPYRQKKLSIWAAWNSTLNTRKYLASHQHNMLFRHSFHQTFTWEVNLRISEANPTTTSILHLNIWEVTAGVLHFSWNSQPAMWLKNVMQVCYEISTSTQVINAQFMTLLDLLIQSNNFGQLKFSCELSWTNCFIPDSPTLEFTQQNLVVRKFISPWPCRL